MDKLTKTIDTLNQTIDTLSKNLGSLSCYDILVLIIQILILGVLGWTAFYIGRQLKTQSEQSKTQNKMFEAQLLKDRIMLGWQTDEPITEDHINNVEFLPSGYLPKKYKEIYINIEKVRGKKREMNPVIGKYLYLAKVYDYFLYTYIIYIEMELPDPWGDKWQETWLKELQKDEVFKDIRKMNEKSHPYYEEFLKSFEDENNTSHTVTNNDSQEQNKTN